MVISNSKLTIFYWFVRSVLTHISLTHLYAYLVLSQICEGGQIDVMFMAVPLTYQILIAIKMDLMKQEFFMLSMSSMTVVWLALGLSVCRNL